MTGVSPETVLLIFFFFFCVPTVGFSGIEVLPSSGIDSFLRIFSSQTYFIIFPVAFGQIAWLIKIDASRSGK